MEKQQKTLANMSKKNSGKASDKFKNNAGFKIDKAKSEKEHKQIGLELK